MMPRFCTGLLLPLVVFLLTVLKAEAQEPMEEKILKALFETRTFAESEFTREFIAEVPLADVMTFLQRLREQVGPISQIDNLGDNGFLITTPTHRIDAKLVLTGDNRISGLWFDTPQAIVIDFASLTEELTQLPGDVALMVTRDDQVLFSHRADQPLAVGSAFKLGVLSVLANDIQNKDRAWDDVVVLQPHHISLPSGMLQDMPVGSPLTLHSAAALMISISDNTATDLLIDTIGRQAMVDELGAGNDLTTRDLFILKTDDELSAEFRATEPEGRAAFLDGLRDHPLPSINGALPFHQMGLEWYIPAVRLCELIRSVGALELMSINPGAASKRDWQTIAYKGGSENGVLNMTTMVSDKLGRHHCVVLTINSDSVIEQEKAQTLYSDLLRSLTAVP